jgi:hypothetical protein
MRKLRKHELCRVLLSRLTRPGDLAAFLLLRFARYSRISQS